MDFAQLLAAASAAMSSPEELVGRSARARAAAQGVSPEQILAGWAGVEVGDTPAPAAPAAAEAAAPAAPTAPQAPVVELDVEVTEPTAAAPEAAPPEPDEEPEPEEEPEEILIGSAGIREMKRRAFPRWLAASFFVIPLIALFYAATFATGPSCGRGGALAIDPATGVAVNCDGSEYGSLGGNPLAVGAALYAVEAGPACSTCHGSDGGGGTGPALAGGAVVNTFPSCADHIQWVALGTNGWRAEVGETYGANGKPVGGGGVMQGYGGESPTALTPEQIAAVVLFERVSYGNVDVATATEDCFPPEEAEAGG